MPDALPTVTLEGVQVLEANVEIHGVGSPPEGDVYTPEDLRAMAAAAKELEDAGEWRAAAKVGEEPLGRSKLGHGKKQALLESGELPAAGWLTNQRVSEDGTKLLADVVDVPAKVASLIKARAYRTRSAELSRVKSQKTGKTYDWVVSGLAWLGGKMPAVRTLDDIVALYEGANVVVERRFMQFDEEKTPSADELRDALASIGTAAARDYAADQELIRELRVELASNRKRRADIRRDVPETTYTAEQRKTFAEATGLDEDKVTDEMLTAAGVAVETDEDEPKRDLEADERMRKLEEEQATTKRELAESKEALRVERRAQFVDAALKDGRIEPGQREQVEKLYDADPESAKTFVDSLPPNEEFAREYGTSEDDDAETPESKAYEAHLATLVGSTEGLI